MCGIAGIYKLKDQVGPEDIQTVQRLMDAQIHRGPDDSGLYQNKNIVLGHRRLAIIDLSRAGDIYLLPRYPGYLIFLNYSPMFR